MTAGRLCPRSVAGRPARSGTGPPLAAGFSLPPKLLTASADLSTETEKPILSWGFPLSGSVDVEVRISGGPVGAAEIAALRRSIEVIEIGFRESLPPAESFLHQDTVVQLKPSADPVFGGLLMRVQDSELNLLRGYLLRPHRGGCREAWWKARPGDVDYVGRVIWPEAAWGFRPYASAWAAAAGLDESLSKLIRAVRSAEVCR